MSSLSLRRAPRMKLLCALVASCFAAEGFANPTGPSVVSGSASFSTVGKALTVTNSPNAIINWHGFSIGAGEITRFQQQNAASAVLNRVVGQDPSAIFGTLSSNGRVFLINPNGVLFGQGSRIDVAGLVASTLNITNQDFLAGRLNFQAGAVTGSIVNQGEIVSSSGGRIYLIAPDVQNHGLISSPGGDVLLAAGRTVSLVDADVPNLKVEVQAGGEALNVGKIIADGGRAGIYAGLINQRGVVRADSVSKDATGKIVFKASDTTILDDGSVTSAAGAKGGEIQVLGNKVGLVGTAKIDASGDAGGGTVLVGGDYQGKNPDVQNAWRTYMAPQSSIVADAITTGDGGKVVVWSDDATRAYGSISARGGSQSGNGGFVEVSGKNWLDFHASVDTRAARGKAGTLLLDPMDVTISTAGPDSGGTFDGGSPDNKFSSGGNNNTSTLTWGTIDAALAGSANVFVTTASNGTAAGNIVVADAHTYTSSSHLTLLAHNNITVNGAITNNGSGWISLWAGWDNFFPSPGLVGGVGTVTVAAPVIAALGTLRISGGTTNLNANITGAGLEVDARPSAPSTFGVLTIAGGVTASATASSPNTFSAEQIVLQSGAKITGTGQIVLNTNSASLSAGQVLADDILVRNNTVGGGDISLGATVGGKLSLLQADLDALKLNAPASGVLEIGGGTSWTNNIDIAAAISFNSTNVQTLKLNAAQNITQASNASLILPVGVGRLAALAGGDVLLDQADNVVATLAGTFTDQFRFKNAQSLTIGTVAGTVGISNALDPGPTPSVQVTVTAGNLAVNSPISVTDGGGSDGTTGITLNAPSISVNNTTITATSDVNDSGDGQPVSVVLNANSGGILISNSSVTATGGQGGGGGDSGGAATLGLNAFGGITVSTSSTISATGGAGAPDSISGANGGDANVALHAGGTINTSASVLSATGGAPVNSGTAGVSTATVEVSSLSGNASPAGDIVVHNVTANNVNLQQQSLNSAKSILRASGTSLITATQVLMEADDAANVGGGSIGTTAAPMRIQAARFEAHTHEASPGIFIESPNAGNLQIGGVSFFSGSVKGVQAVAGGDISIGVNGTLTLQSGSANTPCGVGTGGPICTTSGNITLRAEDMVINHSIATTGTVALAPFTQSRQINIESSPSGGVLSLTPAEIAFVATPGTLEIGRIDGNATMVVNTALATGNVNAGTLRLYSGNINFTTGGADIGSSGTPFAHNLELKANNDVQLTVGNIYVADGKNLTVVADNDASGVGNLNIGAVSVLVGSTGANTGSMTLQARDINAILSSNGGGNLRVFGTGSQTITAAGSAIFRNTNNSIGSLFVQADGGTQTISANSIELTAGTGSSTVAQILAMNGSQNITVGSGGMSLLGGNGTATSSDAMISASGAQSVIVNGGGDITLTGGSGSGNNNSARIRALLGSQTITFNSGGDLVLTGGTVGNLNLAQIVANNATIGAQTQTITGATGITLTGGASGGGLDGSNNSLGNFARILNNAGSQNISVGSGGITLIGGGGLLTSNFAGIFQGTSSGAPGTTQTLTINNGGTVSLNGGSSAQTNVINNVGNFFRGSYAMIQGNGDSQQINFTSGGAISLTGGSVGSNNPAQIYSRFGMQTISGAPSITLQGGTGGYVDVATNKNEGNFARIHSDVGGQSITASAITLTGGASGVGNHAQIFNNSASATQSVNATSISLTGGAGGGIDSGSTGQSMGNYANIQSNGAQTVDATNISLHAGAGGTENFAVIIAPTQTISVTGDLSLVGGGSASGAVRGGGARIGGNGGSAPTPTDLTLLVGGNVTMTGGSLANAGTAIGSSSLGGQTTAIDIDVSGNVTLNPGTVVDGGSRIGSPATNMAGGDIAITAGGTLALNSSGALGTAIRTLGNVTINAASITQGAASEIISGGTLTTLTSGSQTLNGTNTVTSLNATTSGGSLHFTNATTLTVLNASTSGGAVDLTVNSGDLNIPGQINAGSGAVTLAAPTGTVNGTGTSPDIVGGTLDIAAANIIGAGGLHLSVPQINSLVATAGQIDVQSFTTATLLNAQASGSIALNSTSPLTIAGPVVSSSGQVTINSPATSFAGNVSLTNYTFGSSTTLSSGTLNLAGITTVPVGTTVAVQGGTFNASSGTVEVAGTMQTTSGSVSASTMNVSGLFNASGGSVTVGTLNVLAGGTLSGTGTIVGNVNNSAGIVSPGASPGILTIQGNYVQGPLGVLDMQVGVPATGTPVAGVDYDQLKVIGLASLGGTLNPTVIGTAPALGATFTLVDATLGISGTFATVNQPVGMLFNTFYGPTTMQVIGAAINSGSVPAPIAPTFNQVIVSTEQLSQPLIEVIEPITVAVLPPTTTTTPEGQIVPKPPACN